MVVTGLSDNVSWSWWLGFVQKCAGENETDCWVATAHRLEKERFAGFCPQKENRPKRAMMDLWPPVSHTMT